MKITHLLITASVIAFSAQAASAQGRKHHKKKSAERSAAREEFILDKKDTHGSQNEPGKDTRPEDLGAYHKHTYSRIVSLAKAGSLTNDQATEFKLTHTEITNQIKTAKESDTLTAGKKTSIRKDLNDLNDTINLPGGSVMTGNACRSRHAMRLRLPRLQPLAPVRRRPMAIRRKAQCVPLRQASG